MGFFVVIVAAAMIALWLKNAGMEREPEPVGEIGGVCAGIAVRFALDVTFVRILCVLWLLSAGAGLISYLILCAIVPVRQGPPRGWHDR